MSLIDLIEKDVIKVPLQNSTKNGVIEELLELLRNAGKIDDFSSARKAILDREAQGSTGLEKGIAVPHAKTNTVNKLTMAIGISPKGIDFEAQDGKSSHLFFLMLAPPDQSGPHIEALREIAILTRSPSFCDELIHAGNPDTVIDLLRE